MKCPHCETENLPDNDYCGRCGGKLDAKRTDSSVPSWLLDERRVVEEGIVREAPFINPASWSIAQRRRWIARSSIPVAFMVAFLLFVAFITNDTLTQVLFIIISVFFVLLIVAVYHTLSLDEDALYR